MRDTCVYLALIAGFFLWFAGQGLGALFSPDDMMNLHIYWNQGWSGIVKNNLLFPTSAYRPLGGLYYYTIYEIWGLSLTPYRLIAFGLALANLYPLYRFALALTRNRNVALAATALGAVHPALTLVYFSNAVIYEILCYGLTYLALALYLEERPLWMVAAMYVLALNAKEMAVIVPAFVVVNELLRTGGNEQRRWRTMALLCGMTVVYIAGKRLGPDSLFDLEPYRLEFSLNRYSTTSALYLQEIFHQLLPRKPWLPAVVFSLLVGTAAVLRCRVLALASVIAIGGFLPVNFAPPRESFVLYLPLVGWAIYAAALLGRVVPGRVLPVAAVGLMFALNIPGRQRMASPVGAQQLTWDFLHDLRVARIDPPPGACLMIHNDPFHPAWDAYFIARLLYDDRSLRVTLRNAEDKTSRGDECSEGESLHYVWNPDRSLTDGRRRAPPESRYSR